MEIGNLAESWEQIEAALIQRKALPYLGESDLIFLDWIFESISKLFKLSFQSSASNSNKQKAS